MITAGAVAGQREDHCLSVFGGHPMTPREYFIDICRPTLEEFRAEPTSLRRAWTAASSLYHLQDWVAQFRGVEVSIVRREFQDGFPEFQALADISNASKHFKLDRDGPRKDLSATDFRVGSGAAFSDDSYFSDGSSFSDMPDVVRVEFAGQLIDVLHLCGQAATYLETKV
jgi:hypothetical protein